MWHQAIPNAAMGATNLWHGGAGASTIVNATIVDGTIVNACMASMVATMATHILRYLPANTVRLAGASCLAEESSDFDMVVLVVVGGTFQHGYILDLELLWLISPVDIGIIRAASVVVDLVWPVEPGCCWVKTSGRCRECLVEEPEPLPEQED